MLNQPSENAAKLTFSPRESRDKDSIILISLRDEAGGKTGAKALQAFDDVDHACDVSAFGGTNSALRRNWF
jgi:hypothetical protein